MLSRNARAVSALVRAQRGIMRTSGCPTRTGTATSGCKRRRRSQPASGTCSPRPLRLTIVWGSGKAIGLASKPEANLGLERPLILSNPHVTRKVCRRDPCCKIVVGFRLNACKRTAN
eukprot:scaffold116912_cov66-Phaeocystis_antarctica.AAC.3